jgi:hypothetical protein
MIRNWIRIGYDSNMIVFIISCVWCRHDKKKDNNIFMQFFFFFLFKMQNILD